MQCFLVFIANNAKITHHNSLLRVKTQPLNNQRVTLKSMQSHLIAIPKGERSHTEGRAKGERRNSVITLNFNRLTNIPSLYIIRNKNEEISKF